MLNDAGCGDLIKVLWWDKQGLCLVAKQLERGQFLSYGLCQQPRTRVIARCGPSVGAPDDHRSARVRTPVSIDGRSDSYSGIGYPMRTAAAAAVRARFARFLSIPASARVGGCSLRVFFIIRNRTDSIGISRNPHRFLLRGRQLAKPARGPVPYLGGVIAEASRPRR